MPPVSTKLGGRGQVPAPSLAASQVPQRGSWTGSEDTAKQRSDVRCGCDRGCSLTYLPQGRPLFGSSFKNVSRQVARSSQASSSAINFIIH